VFMGMLPAVIDRAWAAAYAALVNHTMQEDMLRRLHHM
jgi:hypothetical protein